MKNNSNNWGGRSQGGSPGGGLPGATALLSFLVVFIILASVIFMTGLAAGWLDEIRVPGDIEYIDPDEKNETQIQDLVDVRVFDADDESMVPSEIGDDDIAEYVEEHMQTFILEERTFRRDTAIARGDGGRVLAEDSVSVGESYTIAVRWKGQYIHDARMELTNESANTVFMSVVPSRPVENMYTEGISMASDARDVSTGKYEFQIGGASHDTGVAFFAGGEHIESIYPEMSVDDETHRFQFHRGEAGEKDEWSEDFFLWESEYHATYFDSEKVGESMYMMQWQYHFYESDVMDYISTIGSAGIAGATAGAAAGAVGGGGVGAVPGAVGGAVLGSSLAGAATALEPEIVRSGADGGVQLVTAVVTPRVTWWGSKVVEENTGAEVSGVLDGSNTEDMKRVVGGDLVETRSTGSGYTADFQLGVVDAEDVDYEQYRSDVPYDGSDEMRAEKSGYNSIKNDDDEHVHWGRDAEYVHGETGYALRSTSSLSADLYIEPLEWELNQGDTVDLSIALDYFGSKEIGDQYLEDNMTVKLEDMDSGTIIGEVDKNISDYITEPEMTEDEWPGDWPSGANYINLGGQYEMVDMGEITNSYDMTVEDVRIVVDIPTVETAGYDQEHIVGEFFIDGQVQAADHTESILFSDLSEPVGHQSRIAEPGIPVYQPPETTARSVDAPYHFLGIDVSDWEDSERMLSVAWNSRTDVDIGYSRVSVEGEGWSEDYYLLWSDDHRGFEDLRWTLVNPDENPYVLEDMSYEDYHALTSPSGWERSRSVTGFTVDEDMIYIEDWEHEDGYFDTMTFRTGQWWENMSGFAKMGLLLLGVLAILVVVLIVAPGVLVALVKGIAAVVNAGRNAFAGGGNGGWS